MPTVMKEFLRTLEINQFMTDYVISPPEFEPLSEFIINEKPLDRPEGKKMFFLVTKIVSTTRARITIKYFIGDFIRIENVTSNWLRKKFDLPQKGVIIGHVPAPKATIFIPIEWQYSMEKLFAEFASIYYLTWDLSNMSPMETTKEFLRRLVAIVTRNRIYADAELKTVYSTPQPGFFSESMIKLNALVIHAIACPPSIPIEMVNKLHLDAVSEETQNLKWVWGMEKIRVFDHVTTEMLKLNVTDLKDSLQHADDKSFGAWDSSWLEGFSDAAMVLRILYQVRPVMLQDMPNDGDVYIRQALNAFDEAKLCPVGTLEELTEIRETANKNNGYRGRFGGRFGRRPFKKDFYEGLNIQAWPMPAQGKRWRRFNQVGPSVNHPVQLNPYDILNKASEKKPEIKDETVSDAEQSIDPTVTVNYKKLPSTGNHTHKTT